MGNAALTNPENTIGQLAGTGGLFPVIALTTNSGSLAITASGPLTIAGTVNAAGGNLFVNTGTNVLTFGQGGSLVSQAGGTIGLLVGGVSNLGTTGATGVVLTTGGLFELAAGDPTAPLTLGAQSGLSLTNLTGIGANRLRLGSVTLPGSLSPTTSVRSIAIAGTFDAANSALELDASGAVTRDRAGD